MLEIDLVRVAMEHGPDWELMDRLSDRYLQAIDMSTAPRIRSEDRGAIERRLHDLRLNDAAIRSTFEWYADLPAFAGLPEAYDSTLDQVVLLAGL